MVSQSVLRQAQDKSVRGIPIGNLTSQIFANIYLNEFDRFVRHHLKPLGYIRYGDDFVLFTDSKSRAMTAQKLGTTWFRDSLLLDMHTKNDTIFMSRYGIRFLGHIVYPNSIITIERHMRAKINKNISSKNAASYGAMYLTRKQARQLPWLLIPYEP